jgi:hypothetical protein
MKVNPETHKKCIVIIKYHIWSDFRPTSCCIFSSILCTLLNERDLLTIIKCLVWPGRWPNTRVKKKYAVFDLYSFKNINILTEITFIFIQFIQQSHFCKKIYIHVYTRKKKIKWKNKIKWKYLSTYPIFWRT